MNSKNVIAIVLLFCSINLIGQTKHFVNPTASGNNDGTSWANAYSNLQTAIDSSTVNDTLWLAAGIYIPSYLPTGSPNNVARDKAFVITNNIVILGGFAGNETAVNQRDYNINHTILSGDVNQDDNQNLKTDNLYHVVLVGQVDSATILDGVIIENGYADNSVGSSNYTNALGARDEGAGINIGNASPIIKNCTFRDNYAKLNGGAIYGIHTLTVFENCTFNNNSCNSIGTSFGTGGGAIHVYRPVITNLNTQLRLYNCMFSSNNGGAGGGGIFARFAPVDLYDCTFNNNSADKGGAINMHVTDDPFELRNCTFTNNSAFYGGAYSQLNNYKGKMYDCQFLNNSALFDGGAFNSGGGMIVTNCSFIQNSARNGGVIDMSGDYSTFYNCVFSQNSASGGGYVAAVSNHDNSSGTEYINCTFSQNTAINQSGGAALGLFYNDSGSHPKIKNAIVWGNTLPEISNYPLNPLASMTTTNSILESTNSLNWNPLFGNDGGNNISVDPQFLAPNSNYVRVNSTSPAVDAGINSYNTTATDLAGQPRIHNNTIDLGAFEFGNYSITHQYDTVCNGDSLLVYNTYLSTTANYSFPFRDTITGLDSVVIVHFTELPVIYNFPAVSACNSYHYNGQIFTQSTNFVDTLTSSFGCDSIVFLILTINNSDTSMISQAICDGDSLPIFNTYYNQAGTYTTIGQNQIGCDSVVVLNLSLLPNVSTVLNETICTNGFVSVFNNFYNQTGTYTVTGQNINGCDSSVTLHLTVNNVTLVDTVLFDSTGSIDVTLSGDTSTYQYNWSNGVTTQDLYQLNASGDYTLTVTDSIGCTYSFTFQMIIANTNSLNALNAINISPNPSTGRILIEALNNENDFRQLRIFNVQGQEVFSKSNLNLPETLDISSFAQGVYFMQFQTKDGKSWLAKIVKQ